MLADEGVVCRFATPTEIGEFIAVMLSDKQGGMGFMAGSDVVIDGGMSLVLSTGVKWCLMGGRRVYGVMRSA